MLIDLLRHMEWADARVWAAVPASVMDDLRLRELLLHTHTVQHAFLTMWTRGDLQSVFKETESLLSLRDVREWARSYYTRAEALVGGATVKDLGTAVDLPWAGQVAEYLGHPPEPTSLAETVVQVTSHSTYHRGQVNARLRELGVTPPAVDYIAWLWGGRPAAAWPSEAASPR
jgi:uncharacterized damage-inducible protein DinB